MGIYLNRKYWNHGETRFIKPKYIYTKKHKVIIYNNIFLGIILTILFAFYMYLITFILLKSLSSL